MKRRNLESDNSIWRLYQDSNARILASFADDVRKRMRCVLNFSDYYNRFVPNHSKVDDELDLESRIISSRK